MRGLRHKVEAAVWSRKQWILVLAIFCLGWVLSGMMCKVMAAEWSVQPFLGVKAVYNDNLLLTPLPHDPTYGYWISPAAELAGKTERLEVSSKIAADFVSYYGDEERRFTNIFVPLTMNYKTETDVLGLNGGFVRDNTLMGELRTTGLVLRFTQRNQLTANPSWTRSITEKLSLQTSFQFSNTRYENGLALGLVDYQLLGGSGGLRYQLTEEDQIQLSGSYLGFYTTNSPSPFRASFPGINLALTHAFTESMTGTVYGGPNYVSSTTRAAATVVRAERTVWLFGVNLEKKFESGSIQLNAAREILPSGFGLLIQTDHAGLTISRDITETVVAGLDGGAYLITGITTTSSGGILPEQRYFYLGPRLSWKFSEWWKFDVSYTYGRRESDGLNPALSNATMFMLTYYPPKLALSK